EATAPGSCPKTLAAVLERIVSPRIICRSVIGTSARKQLGPRATIHAARAAARSSFSRPANLVPHGLQQEIDLLSGIVEMRRDAHGVVAVAYVLVDVETVSLQNPRLELLRLDPLDLEQRDAGGGDLPRRETDPPHTRERIERGLEVVRELAV